MWLYNFFEWIPHFKISLNTFANIGRLKNFFYHYACVYGYHLFRTIRFWFFFSPHPTGLLLSTFILGVEGGRSWGGGEGSLKSAFSFSTYLKTVFSEYFKVLYQVIVSIAYILAMVLYGQFICMPLLMKQIQLIIWFAKIQRFILPFIQILIWLQSLSTGLAQSDTHCPILAQSANTYRPMWLFSNVLSCEQSNIKIIKC